MKGPVAIVGAGYVGLPLAKVFADAGHRVVLVESNPAKVDAVTRGESYIGDVPSDDLRALVESGSMGPGRCTTHARTGLMVGPPHRRRQGSRPVSPRTDRRRRDRTSD